MVGGRVVIEFHSQDEYNGFETMARMKITIHNVAPNQYLVDKDILKLFEANHIKYKVITEIKDE